MRRGGRPISRSMRATLAACVTSTWTSITRLGCDRPLAITVLSVRVWTRRGALRGYVLSLARAGAASLRWARRELSLARVFHMVGQVLHGAPCWVGSPTPRRQCLRPDLGGRRQDLIGKVLYQRAQGGFVLRTEVAVCVTPADELSRRQAEHADEPGEEVRVVAHRLTRDGGRVHIGAAPILGGLPVDVVLTEPSEP